MFQGSTVFSQIMSHIPIYEFNKCVKRYNGNNRIKSFTCLNQFYSMAFAQLTYRESLRDIEACFKALRNRLYHIGIHSTVARSTLADANNYRDWRIYADFAQVLINIARPLYAQEEIGAELDDMVYALDSTTIDLCLTLFPWARFRRHKAAVKMHTLIDIHGSIPVFIWISEGKLHDVNILDLLVPEPGSIYLMDRGYIDFERLHNIATNNAFFVILSKSNMQFRRLYSHSNDVMKGVHSDQTVLLTGVRSSTEYPDKLRRVHYYDEKHQNHLYFLTNNFSYPSLTIANLYKCRWQIELFFKWIKQHLRIKAFYGLSENAVKTQIWIAISVYVLLAIIKKKLDLEPSLYTILQVASVSLFEKSPLKEAFYDVAVCEPVNDPCIQLNLFDI
jgi:IS4 transposase